MADCPYPCPRCGSSRLRGHASNEPMGLTCMDCGWIRYVDPVTRELYDAVRQPRTLAEIREQENQT